MQLEHILLANGFFLSFILLVLLIMLAMSERRPRSGSKVKDDLKRIKAQINDEAESGLVPRKLPGNSDRPVFYKDLSPQTPNPRGRPPKLSPETPRRRGRPPKITSEPTSPRPRGRPPKR